MTMLRLLSAALVLVLLPKLGLAPGNRNNGGVRQAQKLPHRDEIPFRWLHRQR